MALDPVANFAEVTVSTTYNASDTSIALTAGHGARLPDPSTQGAFNVTWWNVTDYPNPTDDPNKEIVRVTARSTDTLTVTRGQEGITATTKNTGGKTYKMVLSPTKKMMDDINTAIVAASGSSFNPANGVQLFEDFVSGGNGALANTNPLYGALGWAWAGNGNIDLGQTYEASHPGWVTLGTTTGTTNYSTIAIGAQNGSSGTFNSSGSWVIASGDSFTMHWWVRFPNLSVLAQRYKAYVGFGDNSNSEPSDGIYFVYDESTSANWIIKTAAAASRSTTTTSTAVADNAWIKLSIVYTGGTATYYVDGASVGTHSSNIPTAATSIRAGITKSAGSTARTMDVDAFYLDYTFNASR